MTCIPALLLDLDAYRKMKERPHPAADGLRLLLVLGAALGLAGVVNAILTWATSPSLADVQGVLGRELARLPLWRRLDPDGARLALLASDPGWRALLEAWLRPSPLVALLRLPAALLVLPLGWLVYGGAAHALARKLGGRGSLEQTLGCLALAELPRAFLLAPFLPPLSLAWLGALAWILAGRFVALKAAHGLEGWRAFWAAMLPELALAGALAMLFAAGLTVWLVGQVLP